MEDRTDFLEHPVENSAGDVRMQRLAGDTIERQAGSPEPVFSKQLVITDNVQNNANDDLPQSREIEEQDYAGLPPATMRARP
ncbi:hypothetical protein CGMCC3_g17150 [Colletotrichum fructicola]|nr:uncharacterized protein CGMCC3_g17150 [Colletotrichum fructicola]KAE9566695.1 hypothetical protein CGMCC3_g17150 [Colletotrichum fructicola]